MKLRRSPRELRDRSFQELRNFGLLIRPPKPGLRDMPPSPLAVFPNPQAVAERLRGTEFAGELLHTADQSRP